MRRILTLAVFVLCGTAVAVSAQTGNRLPLQFVSNGDTVIGALSGATFSVTVQSGYDPSGWGLDSFALRFSLDATHLAFVGAAKLCPNTTAPLNTSVVGNVLTVSTSSCNAVYYGQPVFQLTFQLAGGAVDGTWLSMVPVVVLDNGGGAIFDFLPLAKAAMARAGEIYEQHIATPTGLDFAAAAALYGLDHERIEDAQALREALPRALASKRASILEVPGERSANLALHERAWEAAARELNPQAAGAAPPA